ncbi:MAG: hypothetical protein UY04_C0013G0008 [Parcubacteria group bacterium GW2011_GWA2_47_7]|nr:MAG: hypothetical protein UY04_C0013G0008 [Parcubacteria group bacterium GW2011_GWA2_47_7]
MKLKEFMEKYKLPDNVQLSGIPLQHPETKEKIYVSNAWSTGFWYRKIPYMIEGRIYPCQYTGDLLDLEVYLRARNEIAVFTRAAQYRS